MTNRPKAIGTFAETGVTRYARVNGFPFADRIAQHGALDEADVQLCPGVVVEVKGGKRAESASDGLVASWLVETEVERVNRGADVAFLVLKRKGKGLANVGAWWAILPGRTFVELAVPSVVFAVLSDVVNDAPPVRLLLADALTLLRRAGYGDPIEKAA